MWQLVDGQRSTVVQSNLAGLDDRTPAGTALHKDAAPFPTRTFQNVHASPSNQMWMLPVPRAFSYSDSATPGVRHPAPPRAPIICR